MHEQGIIHTRGVGAETNCETGEAIVSSFDRSNRVLKLTVAEQNTRSFIDTVLSWLAARECEYGLHKYEAKALDFELSEQRKPLTVAKFNAQQY